MAQAQPEFNSPGRALGFDQPLVNAELATMDGRSYWLRAPEGNILVVDFWSAECPVSRRYDPYLSGFARSFGPKGVTLLAVDSNVYEDEGQILRAIEERDIPFPILRDPRARLADHFGAQTTPHIFVFDAGGMLRYRGAIDDVTFANSEPTTNYLETVVDALLLGRDVTLRETTPYGCTINRAWEG